MTDTPSHVSGPPVSGAPVPGADVSAPPVFPGVITQYQTRDWDVVDYQMYVIPGLRYTLRGPKVAEGARHYASIIGAGQSFGVLVRDPYAHKLARDLSMEVMNLSVGGSAPALYLGNPAAIAACNASSLCIIQILGGRSSHSTYFESRDGKNMLRPRGSKLPFVPGDTAYEAMFASEPPIVPQIVIGEVRANWTKEMLQLLALIKVPKILLWFSERSPDALPETFTTYRQAAGKFPHFVTRKMIDEIRDYADDYVEVVSTRGMPNRLTNRFTGEPARILLGDGAKPASEDPYYPSPEMHEDAHAALLAPVRRLWTAATGAGPAGSAGSGV
jgi:hypothetical protein